MILLNDMRKKYCGRTVLDIERLELQTGRIHAVLGPNGSGKSTLLRLLAGMEAPDSGHISLEAGNGAVNEAGNPAADPGEISYLPQHPYLFDFSVRDNVRLGLQDGKDGSSSVWIDEMLEMVGMKAFSGTRANTLSGGEAQRAAVARTLIRPSGLLLLDEPTSAADIAGMRQVEEAIRTVWQRNQATVVMSTHNPSQAMRLAHRVIYMQAGRVVEAGDPVQVLKEPGSTELKEFLANWVFG